MLLGPMMRLLDLRESELPDPMMRWMQTVDPDCEEDQEGAKEEETTDEADKPDRRRGGGDGGGVRGRSGRRRAQKNKAQNDMAPVESEAETVNTMPAAELPAPVHGESRAYDSSTMITPTALAPLVALCLCFLQARPH